MSYENHLVKGQKVKCYYWYTEKWRNGTIFSVDRHDELCFVDLNEFDGSSWFNFRDIVPANLFFPATSDEPYQEWDRVEIIDPVGLPFKNKFAYVDQYIPGDRGRAGKITLIDDNGKFEGQEFSTTRFKRSELPKEFQFNIGDIVTPQTAALGPVGQAEDLADVLIFGDEYVVRDVNGVKVVVCRVFNDDEIPYEFAADTFKLVMKHEEPAMTPTSPKVNKDSAAFRKEIQNILEKYRNNTNVYSGLWGAINETLKIDDEYFKVDCYKVGEVVQTLQKLVYK